MSADHGLLNHNRRFYFDAINWLSFEDLSFKNIMIWHVPFWAGNCNKSKTKRQQKITAKKQNKYKNTKNQKTRNTNKTNAKNQGESRSLES